MINSLFVNAAILTTFLYLSSQLFKNTIVNIKSAIKIKILIGFIFGICGCVLMFNGINLVDNMIMDFRLIALIISAIFCGPISTFMTALCIISFRIGYFGISNASLIASANLIILSCIFSFVSISKYDYKTQYIYMCIANALSSVFWNFVFVKDANWIFKILSNYILSTIIVSFIIYFVLAYSFKTAELYLKLKQEASKDYLTGLNNVREFDFLLNQSISNTLENNKNLSMIMLDLDNFKKVNDTYGHTSGDLILKQFSDILSSSCRSFDIISRKGGEEFSVIMLDCNYVQAIDIAERIRMNVQEYHFTTDKSEKIKITVSIGVSSFPSKTDNINNLLQDADKALYIAKQNGRNQIQ
ncbi:diguanylate cyclase [Desulfitobacterium sp. Sab5]|uniref:diguanylate cyclase n=1 Tax=Desulfitobacterium nosdiversum TaxID=3375356 RepID=UPI003CF35C7B